MLNGTFSFDSDYAKSKHNLKDEKTILVDLHRYYERGIRSKSLDMQKRFINHISGRYNLMQLSLGWIKLQNGPETGLIRIEVCLVNNQGQLFE